AFSESLTISLGEDSPPSMIFVTEEARSNSCCVAPSLVISGMLRPRSARRLADSRRATSRRSPAGVNAITLIDRDRATLVRRLAVLRTLARARRRGVATFARQRSR